MYSCTFISEQFRSRIQWEFWTNLTWTAIQRQNYPFKTDRWILFRSSFNNEISFILLSSCHLMKQRVRLVLRCNWNWSQPKLKTLNSSWQKEIVMFSKSNLNNLFNCSLIKMIPFSLTTSLKWYQQQYSRLLEMDNFHERISTPPRDNWKPKEREKGKE